MSSDKNKLPAKKEVYETEHLGVRYNLVEIVEKEQQHGLKLSEVLAGLGVPKSSIDPLKLKINKTAYYTAYKNAKTSILAAAGHKLQANMLDLAFNSRSEMVRFSATDSALKRVYGEDTEEAKEKPAIVFNFSFGSDAPKPTVTTAMHQDIIEVEPLDG